MAVGTRSAVGPLVGLAVSVCFACRTAGPAGPTGGTAAEQLMVGAPQAIPSDVPFASLEGPYWVAGGGYLIFSDVVERNGAGAKIYRFDPGTRAFTVVRYPDAPVSTNGLAVDAEGRLLPCERWNGVLARVSGGRREILADRSPEGRPLNAPNDVALRRDGNIYFSDTTWGAPPGPHDKPAVYRLSPAGILSVAFRVDMPNGVVLSPDERALYVGSDAQDRLWRLSLADDGAAGSPQPFGDMQGPGKLHVPDGLCVDDTGRVYVTNNSAEISAIVVFAPDGRYAGRIPLPVPPSNCTFGGADRRTLYITTLHAIYESRSQVPGLP